MPAGRYSAFSVLILATAACAGRRAPTNPVPLDERGPKASIHAQYIGGLLDRSVDATFRVEQKAYVMVAHLGGDGYIDIVYPESPHHGGLVYAKTSYRTQPFSAYYDAFPTLYSYSTTRHRSLNARSVSYDGGGHGFVFLIASRRPLRFDKISSYGMWNDFEVGNYGEVLDPHDAISAFAEFVAGRNGYTLRYALPEGALAFSYGGLGRSYADRQRDCAFLAIMGLTPFGSLSRLDLEAVGLDPHASSLVAGCAAAYRYAYGFGLGFPYYGPWGYGPPIGNPGAPGGPANPTGTISLPRPGNRAPGRTGPALDVTRSTFTRRTAPEYVEPQRTYGPRDPEFGARSLPRSYPRGETPRQSPRSNPTYDPPSPGSRDARPAPVYDAPKAPPPRPSVERVSSTPPVQHAPTAPSPQNKPEERKPQENKP